MSTHNLSYDYLEIERIYTQTLCRGIRSIAISASVSQEGASTVAQALAQRASAADLSTLLVDFNLLHPTPLAQFEQLSSQGIAIDDSRLSTQGWLPTPESSSQAIVKLHNTAISFLPAPLNSQHTLPFREPANLKRCLTQWLSHFDVVIMDTSPVNAVNRANIPAETIAASCDGVLLVTLAGVTAQKQISLACDKLQNAKASILGVILNNQYNPTLKREMLRELQRFSTRWPRLCGYLQQKIQQSDLLNGY